MQQPASTYKKEELPEAARALLQKYPEKKIFAFYGSMGAGKTTFIQAICKVLGVEDNVSSPTFSIVNEYETKYRETIYHFDFYRLKDQQEAMDIGYEDYLYSGNYVLIEWPEKIEELLPENSVYVQISETEEPDSRALSF